MQFRPLFCVLLLLYGLPGWSTSTSNAQEAPGSLDKSFFIGAGADSSVYSIAIQPDGKILIGGVFNQFNGRTNRTIARINSNGSADPGFTSPISDPTAQGLAIAVQTNGQILLGMEASTAIPLLRLASDGTIDSSFNQGAPPDGGVHAIAIQPDGKILIGGQFTHVHSLPQGRIARLNTDGTLDGTFIPGAGADYIVETIQLAQDGRIYIGGQFHNYRNISRNGIARLTTNGSLDATFNPGQGANASVFSMAIQPDGKPLIGGFFDMYDGNPQNAVARLNTNGTYDAAFQSLGVLADGTVYAMELQRDGKVVVAGDMTQGHLVRVNPDGTQDSTYQPGLGPSDDVYAMAIQKDQKIIIGGLFPTFDVTPMNFIARLNADLKCLAPVKAGSTFSTQIQTVSGHSYRLQYKTAFDQATWTDIIGADVTGDGTVKTIQDHNATAAPRFYRVYGFAD